MLLPRIPGMYNKHRVHQWSSDAAPGSFCFVLFIDLQCQEVFILSFTEGGKIELVDVETCVVTLSVKAHDEPIVALKVIFNCNIPLPPFC